MFQFDEENGAITDVNREISCGLAGVPGWSTGTVKRV